jgi:hypothetical protein
MTLIRTHKGRRIALVASAAALLCLVISVGLASAASPPGAVPGLVSTTHPNPALWYQSTSPAFTWNAAPAGTSPISGYSFVLDQNPSTVPIVSGSGGNSFAAQVSYAVGSAPAEDRVADFNGDGKLDIVVENANANTVSVLLGRGDGTFQAAVNYGTDTHPWSMDLGDVNSDGKIDIVTCNTQANSVSVLNGRGDGTFQAAVNYSTGANSSPEAVRLGDLNGDGKLDIVTANAANNNNTISVLRNNGNGTFAAPTTFGTGLHPTSIAFGDLNGDGKLDIVAANYNSNNVSVLAGNGDCTFQSAVNYGCGTGPQIVAVADFNGDGKPDVATVNYGTNNASVLLNTGSGTLAAKVDYAVGSGPYSLSVADLNHDGALDLVSVNHSANTISVLYGNGNGTFAAKSDLATGRGPFWVAIGDFNGSGFDDLAVTNTTDNTVGVLIGTGFFRPASSALEASFAGKADGVWYFHVRAVDTAGVGGPTTTCTVRIDTTPPSTTQSGADGAWHATPVTVTFSPGDASSGVASTEYKVDAGTWTTGGSVIVPAPSDGSNNGSHTVQYRSTDNAGNVETAKSNTVNIVTTAPTTSVSGADGAWHSSAVTLTFSSGSPGVVATEYSLDGGTTWITGGSVVIAAPADGSNDGTHTVLYRSRNGAGLVETAKSCAVKIDVAAPTTTASGFDGAWHNSPVTLGFAGSDAGSGVASTEYRVDGGAWTAGASVIVPAPSDGSNDGTHTVQYRSTDVMGHTEVAKSASIKIDGGAPTTAVTGADSAWHSADVALAFAGSDPGSGVASTEYKIDGGAWTAGTSVTIPAAADGSNDGVHTVRYRSTDVAGNVEDAGSCEVKIVTVAPVSSVTGATEDWQAADVTLTFSASGAGAPVTEYSRDGGTTWTTGASVTIPAPPDGSNDGVHTVLYRSVNGAGIAEAVHTTTVRIDAAAPTTAVSGADGAWHASDVALSFTGSDAGSGVTSTEYRVDGGAWTAGAAATVPAAPDGSNDGVHTVLCRSTDALGHTENPAKSCAVKIDTTAPTTTQSGADMAWHDSDVTVTFTGSDNGSGVAYTEYRVDGGPWLSGGTVLVPAAADGSNDGVHTVDYRSTDVAGHTEDAKGCVVKIDVGGPVTVDNAGASWHAAPFTLQLTATNRSTADTTTQFSVGDTAHWQTGTTVAFGGWKRGGGSGLYVVYYRSLDAAGRVESQRSCTVMLDASRPVTRDDAPKGAQASDVTVHLMASDTFSGVAQTWYQVDGGPWLQGAAVVIAAPADHTNDGGHTIKYFSVDNAGNSEAGYRVCSVVIATH